jgi:hypothetical protein
MPSMTRTDEFEALASRIDAAFAMVARRFEQATDRVAYLINRAPGAGTSADTNLGGNCIELDIKEAPVNPLRHWRWE